jgi:truncated hemoglobin YjbI
MGSIYAQLGGKPAVEAAVDDFYHRVIGDETLAPYFHGIDLDRLKRHQRAFLAVVLGSSDDEYVGRSMAAAHARFQISDHAFDRVVEHLGATLASLGVDDLTVEAIADRLGPLRAEIVAAYTPGEHEAVAAFLDHYRTLLLDKVRGLDEEQLRWPASPTGTSLLSIVKRLTYVERWWFAAVFGGEEVEFPWSRDDPDADRRVESWETAAEIIALYRAEARRSRTITASAKLDDVARGAGGDGHRPTLRWVLLHMLEQTARHCGQADILREALDARPAADLDGSAAVRARRPRPRAARLLRAN